MSELKKLTLQNQAAANSAAKKEPTLTKTTTSTKQNAKLVSFASFLVAILAGTGTGYLLYRYLPNTVTGVPSSTSISSSGVSVGEIIGLQDEKTFKDSAEGVLVKGGVEGEGSHHIEREGGPSQNVYLTSSVIDLDELVGHKVKIWGETFTAQHAGWLMDVGRVKVLELNAEKPF